TNDQHTGALARDALGGEGSVAALHFLCEAGADRGAQKALVLVDLAPSVLMNSDWGSHSVCRGLAALPLEQRQCRRRWQVDACQGSLTLVIHEPAFARRAPRCPRGARRAPPGPGHPPARAA